MSNSTAEKQPSADDELQKMVGEHVHAINDDIGAKIVGQLMCTTEGDKRSYRVDGSKGGFVKFGAKNVVAICSKGIKIHITP